MTMPSLPSSYEKIERLIIFLAVEQGMPLPLTEEQHIYLRSQVIEMIYDYARLSGSLKTINDENRFLDDLCYRR